MIPQRVQLKRTQGWRLPPDTVSVARPSKWGNPYRVADYRRMYPHLNEAQCHRLTVIDFQTLVFSLRPHPRLRLPPYPLLTEISEELAGKNLACYCPLDLPCHADVLIEVANVDEPGGRP